MKKGVKKKVYLMGGDGMGWALDKNKYYHSKAFSDLEIPTVNNIIDSNIIYAIWWREPALINWKFKLFKKLLNKNIIATVTNELNHHRNYFNLVKDVIDIWVYFNTKQERFLLSSGINKKTIFWNPSYIDEAIFKPLDFQKKEIAEFLNIDFGKLKGKFLIGSFQRDSLETDLNKPKWEKNPDLLIEILKNLDKNKFVLVLAGPRRHYIINKCIEFGIPYIFIGNEELIKKNIDDVYINTLSSERVNLLYNLINLYIVSSRSEGEPRAVMEAALAKTLILSTDVGIAGDFLDEFLICRKKVEFLKKIATFSKNNDKVKVIIERNYTKVKTLNNYKAFKMRIKEIISGIDRSGVQKITRRRGKEKIFMYKLRSSAPRLYGLIVKFLTTFVLM